MWSKGIRVKIEPLKISQDNDNYRTAKNLYDHNITLTFLLQIGALRKIVEASC